MAKYFGSGQFPLACLKCGHEFSETVSRVEAEEEIPCPKCGVLNRYDAKELREIMRAADKGLDKLRRKMRKLGKR